MYGKLINGEIVEAPEKLVLEDGTVIPFFNRSISKMLEQGYKPIIDLKPGYDVDKQYCIFLGYKEAGRYIRAKWLVEDIEFSEAEIQKQEAQKAMSFLNIDLQGQIQTLPPEQALEVVSLYPIWEVGVVYTVGFMVSHLGILYKVLFEHTSQADWSPDVAISLFSRVIVGQINPDNGEQEILDWVQPDSTNGYMTGDKVRFEGAVYESLIDNNIWSPASYPEGWQLIEG